MYESSGSHPAGHKYRACLKQADGALGFQDPQNLEHSRTLEQIEKPQELQA